MRILQLTMPDLGSGRMRELAAGVKCSAQTRFFFKRLLSDRESRGR